MNGDMETDSMEQICKNELAHISQLLHFYGIEHEIDLWGKDVYHDWTWWRKQFLYVGWAFFGWSMEIPSDMIRVPNKYQMRPIVVDL